MKASVATPLDAVPYYHDLRDAFGQSGCPLCRLSACTAERYLDTVLWELVNDVEVRAELNRARGYCQQHGWLLVRAGASLGIAILMRDVVKTLLDTVAENAVEDAPEAALLSLLRRLGRARPGHSDDQIGVGRGDGIEFLEQGIEVALPEEPSRSRATARLAAGLAPANLCPVCSLVQARERDHIGTLLAHLEGPGALVEVYARSDGLCLAHFRQTLSQASGGSQARLLVGAQNSVWQRLYADLSEFIRKNDQRFRDEPFGEERDAWRRALAAISGPPPRGQSDRQALT